MTAPDWTDADWTDADLADLARDYLAPVHTDVADLIAGVRAVLARCAIAERTEPSYIRARDVVRALNHPEETP